MSADELKKLDVLEVGCGTSKCIFDWLSLTRRDLESITDKLGGGAVTRLLAPTFGSISAIDIEPTMITSLHAHLSPTVFASDPTTKPSSNSEVNVTAFVHTITSKSPASFAAGDKHPSPTPSDPDRTIRPPAYRYDVAIIIMVLHHVENPDEFFAGLTGLLKEGGKVVVIEPNGLETVPPTGMHVKQEVEEGYEEMSEDEVRILPSGQAFCQARA
jgi:ubiquinone/menaquinone biosynthesis C-methylase UbiE